MVYKRFMRKCHTCFGHEARLYKLLIKKPPGMMSAGGASGMCELGYRISQLGLACLQLPHQMFILVHKDLCIY